MTQIITKTTHHFACPDCGETSPQLDHLNMTNGCFGPWYCNGCGIAIVGKFTASALHIERRPERKVRTLVLLRNDPLFLVVEGHQLQREGEALDLTEREVSTAYYYNEGTCPTNYLGVVAIIENGDSDPHGVFQFVEQIVMPDNFDQHNVDWTDIFPVLQTHYI